MSVAHLIEGVYLNAEQCGLLCIDEKHLLKLVKKEPISNVYDVDNMPLARKLWKDALIRVEYVRKTGRKPQTAYLAIGSNRKYLNFGGIRIRAHNVPNTSPACYSDTTLAWFSVKGRFATVKKCTHKKTGVDYAAKFIKKRRRASDMKQDILHEIAVLQMTKTTEAIVRLYEVYETASEMALILELAVGGELQKVLDLEEALEENHAVKYLKQILEGLKFLHERNIAHLDLKPQNILLTGEYPACDIKLCDFGISRVVQDGVEVREILGTPDYVAPEILNYEPIGLATDIWSVGVLAYVLVSGYSPFAGNTKQETFCNISQCNLSFPDELFEGVSEHAKDFIKATLISKPGLRLTVDQCLAHPWFVSTSSTVADVTRSEKPQTNDECNSSSQQEDKKDSDVNKSVTEVDGFHEHELICPRMPDRADSESGDELPQLKRARSSCDDDRSPFHLDTSWTSVRRLEKEDICSVPDYSKKIEPSPVTLLLDRSLIY